MISLRPNNKALDFHYKKVNEIFNNVINKKIGYEKTSFHKEKKFKLNSIIIDFITKNKEELIKEKTSELLRIHLEYKKLDLKENEFDKANEFFIYLYENYFQKKFGKEFLNKLDIHTCLYCNRNYTLDFKNLTNSRAALDHWFPKDKFPILALSFYNLIPSCHSCNHIKGNGDNLVKQILNIPTFKKHSEEEKKNINKKIYDWWKEKSLISLNHPYSSNNKKFKFSFHYESLDSFKVITKTEDKIIEETLKFNKTEEIYNAHSDKELKDLLDLRYKYSENYLEILLEKTFTGLSMSKEEAYRMIFGIEIKEEDYHKRPFSKFKHDIIEELLRIKEYHP